MKVRIENEEDLEEDEIIIRCRKLDERTQKIYNVLLEYTKGSQCLMLQKGNVEYYIQFDDILFFETFDHCISAHTANNVYETTYRLYELEELLPRNFMRVSKSTILNINHIYSISRNLTASSLIQFINTHKQVFVSRSYYKSLKFRLEEKRKSL